MAHRWFRYSASSTYMYISSTLHALYIIYMRCMQYNPLFDGSKWSIMFQVQYNTLLDDSDWSIMFQVLPRALRACVPASRPMFGGLVTPKAAETLEPAGTRSLSPFTIGSLCLANHSTGYISNQCKKCK